MYVVWGRHVDGELTGRLGQEKKIHSANKPSPYRSFCSVDSDSTGRRWKYTVLPYWFCALLLFFNYICYIPYDWAVWPPQRYDSELFNVVKVIVRCWFSLLSPVYELHIEGFVNWRRRGRKELYYIYICVCVCLFVINVLTLSLTRRVT
jgi:hypothetical protein